MNSLLWSFLEDVAAAIKNQERLELVVDGEDVVVDPDIVRDSTKKSFSSSRW